MSINEDFRNKYKLGKSLGNGIIGTVYEATKINSNQKVSIKIIDKNIIKGKFKNKFFKEPTDEDLEPYIECFYNEINNMKTAEGKNKDNENAVKFYECYDNQNEFAIVMELCDKDMVNYLSEIKDDLEILDILKQLNKTLKIMVESNLTYIDIKLENILIKYTNKEKTNYIVKLKLTDDIGLKKQFKKLFRLMDDNDNSNICINAPEILQKKGYNDKSDLWSMGIIIYALFFKKYPYEGSSQEILNQISIGEQIKTNNDKLDNLINQLLVEDSEKRMSWEEYFNHPYFQNFDNFDNDKEDIKDFHDLYEFVKIIGQVGFATVYKAKIKGSNEYRAIKIFDKNRIRSFYKRKYLRQSTEEDIKPYIDTFINEINYMKMLEGNNYENNNTVIFYDYYDTEDEFAIVMELCDDNLLNIITKRNHLFTIDEIYSIVIQLNNSFQIMTQYNLVHRALNLDNILVKYLEQKQDSFIVKLKLTNDSCLLQDIFKNQKLNITNMNINYVAPEILKNEKYDEKCDLWSLGVTLYILAFKESPFNAESDSEILKQIKNYDKKKKNKTEDPELDDLINKLLVEDPIKRLSWNQYFNHPFFRHRDNVRQYYDIENKIGTSEFANIYRAKIKKQESQEL